MKFYFGNRGDAHSVSIEAKDLQHAIKIFKVSELFPEKCVDPCFYAKDSEGHYQNKYDSALGRYHYTFNVENPSIGIYTDSGEADWEKVGSISLMECINVNFFDMAPQRNLLGAPDISGPSEDTTSETLPIVQSAQAVSLIPNKAELREKHDEIARRKAELEMMVRDMNKAMNVIKEELKQKQKVVFIIETYLEAITWWKLKNKWKRAIMVQESTATRMILKKLSDSEETVV